MDTTTIQEGTMTISAYELRSGDKITIDGHIRTVADVAIGQSETSVSFTERLFPTTVILWNGDDCKLA